MADMESGEKSHVRDSVNKADLDTAYGVYEEIRGVEGDTAAQRSLLWKIDLRLMPLMSVPRLLPTPLKSKLTIADVLPTCYNRSIRQPWATRLSLEYETMHTSLAASIPGLELFSTWDSE